jgi:AcrR family transcriptional regulator
MARVPQLLGLERRIPRQQRAQDSCVAIFDAAAQILSRDGMGGLSTNRIAERAGVSIGMLYQYFPNKQAVLLAMGRREIEETGAEVAAALAAAAAAGELPAPRIIHCLVQRFSARRQMRRVLMETVFSQHLHEEFAIALETMARPLLPHGPPAAVFVLTRAMLGVLRGAVMAEDAPDPVLLEQELLRLALSYLKAVG